MFLNVCFGFLLDEDIHASFRGLSAARWPGPGVTGDYEASHVGNQTGPLREQQVSLLLGQHFCYIFVAGPQDHDELPMILLKEIREKHQVTS